VAPAAESVTHEFVERVRDVPQKWRSSVRVSSMGSEEVYCRKERVSEREAGPMPSETMKMRLRFFLFLFLVGEERYGPPATGSLGLMGAGAGEVVELRCWRTTASTMTPAVARRAQAKRIISRTPVVRRGPARGVLFGSPSPTLRSARDVAPLALEVPSARSGVLSD